MWDRYKIMLKVVWIRHGQTPGNQKKRYIGITDEPLCEEGMKRLRALRDRGEYPEVTHLFVSPLLRCRQTAELLYEGCTYQIVSQMRECDFGLFENQNYKELEGNPLYQNWVDSNGTLPFPKGENPSEFQQRCVDSFQQIMGELELIDENREITVGFVVHGGTIMSVMERLCTEKRDYFAWQVQNGEGFICNYTGGKLELCHHIIY